MVLNFRTFMLNENTVAQELKKTDKKIVRYIRFRVESWVNAINVDSKKAKDRIGNMIIKHFIDNFKLVYAQKLPEGKNPYARLEDWWDESHSTREVILQNFMRGMWEKTSDFLSAKASNEEWLSKINDPSYTAREFEYDAWRWHAALAKKKKGKGPKGRKIGIEDGNYHWVSLDRDYCEKEGEAGGHCGNVGREKGDNILSLRDSRDMVHATFVVNGSAFDQSLRESKGVGNQPPAKKYHGAIVKLLLSTHVSRIKQFGSYIDLKRGINNFHISNLTPSQRKQVLSAKPEIDHEEKNLRNLMRKMVHALDHIVQGGITIKQEQNNTVFYHEMNYFEDGTRYAMKLGMTNELQSIYKAGAAGVPGKGRWYPGESGVTVHDNPGGWGWFADKVVQLFDHKDFFNDKGYREFLLNKPIPKDGLDESMLLFHKNLKKYAPWMWEDW